MLNYILCKQRIAYFVFRINLMAKVYFYEIRNTQ